MEAKYLKINPADNVAVAITALPAGEKLTVDGKEITLNEDVPAGHKFALKVFASRRRHTRCLSDWSSDVCSSDL